MTPRYSITLDNMRKALGREPTVDDIKQVKAELKQAMARASEAIVRRHDAFMKAHST